jgi:hypothetical protein
MVIDNQSFWPKRSNRLAKSDFLLDALTGRLIISIQTNRLAMMPYRLHQKEQGILEHTKP